MLINILGCDGAGKTTLMNDIKSYLEKERNFNFISVDKWEVILDRKICPGLNFIKSPTEELKNSLADLSSRNRFLFLTLLYSCSIENITAELKDKNTICVVDGYWYKHLFSEMVVGGDKNWMITVSSDFPEPDFTVVIDVDPEIAYVRKRGLVTRCESGMFGNSSKEGFLEHQTKMGSNILDYARNNNIPIINGNLDSHLVFEQFKSLLDKLL